MKDFMSEKNLHRCQVCDGVSGYDMMYVVNGYPVLRCLSCGVGRVSIEEFSPHDYYDEGYFKGKHAESYKDYLGSKDVITREFQKTLDYIKRYSSSSGRLLEIGCAYGLFLQCAKASYEVHGVEVVKEAAQYCRDSGLNNVKHGEIDRQYIDSIGDLDIVAMLDVIEHIDNVAEVIELISSKLKIGGTLIVTTGDWASIFARFTGKGWRLMAPPFHLWYFTPKSLEALGRKYGLEVISIGHPWKIVPLELIIHQALFMMGISSKFNLPKWLRFFGLPANLYDSMRVVFRKIS